MSIRSITTDTIITITTMKIITIICGIISITNGKLYKITIELRSRKDNFILEIKFVWLNRVDLYKYNSFDLSHFASSSWTLNDRIMIEKHEIVRPKEKHLYMIHSCSVHKNCLHLLFVFASLLFFLMVI